MLNRSSTHYLPLQQLKLFRHWINTWSHCILQADMFVLILLQSTTVNSFHLEYRKFVRIIRCDELCPVSRAKAKKVGSWHFFRIVPLSESYSDIDIAKIGTEPFLSDVAFTFALWKQYFRDQPLDLMDFRLWNLRISSTRNTSGLGLSSSKVFLLTNEQ